MAGAKGIEPLLAVLETDVLPLYDAPMCLIILSYVFAFRNIFKDNKNMKYRFDFIKPKYYESLLRYRYLLLQTHTRVDGCGGIEKYENIESWDFNNKLLEDEATLPKGFSIGFQFLYIDENDEVVGMLNFRPKAHEHEYLSKYGGHIGYGIRPDKHRQGIGTRMLEDFLLIIKQQYADKYNLDKVLITCNEDNIGSRKIILSNGGIFESTVFCPLEDKKIERYWIKI